MGRAKQAGRQARSAPLVGGGPELKRLRDEFWAWLERPENAPEIAAYMAVHDEIQAAAETLEAHSAEFDKLMADPVAALKRATRLFSEERFASLRPTPDDLERAFEAVGGLPTVADGPSSEDVPIMVAIARHLAGDGENRMRLGRQLLMALPETVDAGRYRDAWLIQHSAYCLFEDREGSNPFMFVMLQLAHRAWRRQPEQQRDTLLNELGIGRSAIEGAGLEDIEALAGDLLRDPEKQARLEAFCAAHPKLISRTQRMFEEIEGEVGELLRREDAACILPSPEETAPWTAALVQRTEPLLRQARTAADAGLEPGPDIEDAVSEALLATIREMVPAVYTPERIEQLMQDLRDYRRRLSEAGEREAAILADVVLTTLQRDGPAGDHYVLAVTCYASLLARIEAAREEAGAGRAGARKGGGSAGEA